MQSNLNRTPRIVHIEDNDSDAEFFNFAISALETKVEVERFSEWSTFESYSDKLLQDTTLPLADLFIMDHDVDGTASLDIIKYIRENDTLSQIPIIVFSGYDYGSAVNNYYLAGASSYVRKPQSIDEMLVILKSVADYWFSVNRGPKNRV